MYEKTRPIGLAVAALSVLIMTGCGSSKLQRERDGLMAQNQELQAELSQARADLSASDAERQSLLTEITGLQTELANERSKPTGQLVAAPAPPVAANTSFDRIGDGIETVSDGKSITVRVPGDVLFSSGKVTLKSTAKTTLTKVASILRSEYPGKTIRVEGYTDSDPIRKSRWADNLELSLQRAAAVHRYLSKQGVSAKKMYAAGFGPNSPQSTKAKSRRVEIVVELSS